MASPDSILTVFTVTVGVPFENYNVSDGNTTSNVTEEVIIGGPLHSVAATAIIAILLGLICVTTVCGNLLVCVTIITNRRLHNQTNYFIISLATTDLLVGLLVLPFSALNTLSTTWPLGAVFCNIYMSMDVMLCTVSILTLFAISLDRYFAVTKPLRYQQRMKARIVWRINAGIWIFSFLMAFIPIHVGWNTPDLHIQNWEHPYYCHFLLNVPYAMIIALGTYFGPLLIMCGVYLKVLQITRHQVKEINRLTRMGGGAAPMLRSPDPTGVSSGDDLPNSGGGKKGASVNNHHNGAQKNGGPRHHKHKEAHPQVHQYRASDTKATVTLASVVLAFAICWVPYFAIFTAKPFLKFEVNLHFDLFCLWLGYVNSSINPFLYAFYNSSFREGFKKILCQQCARRRANRPSKMNTLTVRSTRHGSSSETSELSVLRHAV